MSDTGTTREVFEDHLRLRQQHRVEEDIARNYADSVVLLTLEGVFHGHDGVRYTSQTLHELLPGGHYDYTCKEVASEYAYPELQGTSEHASITHGADGYLISDGKIVAQLIHYYIEGVRRSAFGAGKPEPLQRCWLVLPTPNAERRTPHNACAPSMPRMTPARPSSKLAAT